MILTCRIRNFTILCPLSVLGKGNGQVSRIYFGTDTLGRDGIFTHANMVARVTFGRVYFLVLKLQATIGVPSVPLAGHESKGV